MPDETPPAGEFDLIRRLTARLPRGRGVILGPGDDAAVVRPSDGMDLVITTDAFVEGRHFRESWCATPRGRAALSHAVGFRLAAANLSDVAAMAAIPRWAVLSIGEPGPRSAWLEGLERGVAEALDLDGAALVGGNLSQVEGREWSSLALIGEVERGRAWRRAGARPGDLLAITGVPGLAAAFLPIAAAYWSAEESGAHRDAGSDAERLGKAWRQPPSRVGAARAMAASGAVTASIDLSDGVHGDLAQLCEASGVGAEIDEAAWPAGAPPGDARFGPGDDYELLLAVDPAGREACAEAARGAGTPLTFVGRFTAEAGALKLRRAAGGVVALPGRGYDHFDSGR